MSSNPYKTNEGYELSNADPDPINNTLLKQRIQDPLTKIHTHNSPLYQATYPQFQYDAQQNQTYPQNLQYNTEGSYVPYSLLQQPIRSSNDPMMNLPFQQNSINMSNSLNPSVSNSSSYMNNMLSSYHDQNSQQQQQQQQQQQHQQQQQQQHQQQHQQQQHEHLRHFQPDFSQSASIFDNSFIRPQLPQLQNSKMSQKYSYAYMGQPANQSKLDASVPLNHHMAMNTSANTAAATSSSSSSLASTHPPTGSSAQSLQLSAMDQHPLHRFGDKYSNNFHQHSQVSKPYSMIDAGNNRVLKMNYSKTLKPSKTALEIQKPKRSKRKSKFTKEQDDLIVKLKTENKTWVEIADLAKVDSYLAARNRYQVLIGQQGGGSADCGPEDVMFLKDLVDDGELEKMKYLSKEFRKCTDPGQFDVNSSYLEELVKLQKLRDDEFAKAGESSEIAEDDVTGNGGAEVTSTQDDSLENSASLKTEDIASAE